MGVVTKTPGGSARREVRRTKRKNIWETLEYERASPALREIHKDELRVATKHLLHCFRVPEVRFCARKAFPSRGAVQHIEGDGENVKGYKEVRRGLTEARELVARQKRDRQSMDRPVVTSYYKSPVGTRSTKGSGSVFYSDPVQRSFFFSGVKKI